MEELTRVVMVKGADLNKVYSGIIQAYKSSHELCHKDGLTDFKHDSVVSVSKNLLTVLMYFKLAVNHDIRLTEDGLKDVSDCLYETIKLLPYEDEDTLDITEYIKDARKSLRFIQCAVGDSHRKGK